MDLLAKRYASPFTVIEEMIRTGRFFEFVVEINSMTNEETREQRLWDIWLHRVFTKEWDEWRAEIRNRENLHIATESELEATVKNSMELLNSFNPTNGG